MTAATLACNQGAPLQPTPPTVSGGNSANASKLKVSAPAPQSPANGQTLPEIILSGLTLSASPATPTFGVEAALQYEFELMNAAGAVVERSSGLVAPTWTQRSSLDYNTQYQWRVRAVHEGNSGPWSVTATFKTQDLPPSFRCGPPFNYTPNAIIQCHRDMFEPLHDEDVPIMLKRIARDFNRAGVPGGPFGVLWKAHANTCHGYSCDVICSGQGDDQNQWDILIDETYANWGSDIDGIRVDFCEIQPSELVEVTPTHPTWRP